MVDYILPCVLIVMLIWAMPKKRDILRSAAELETITPKTRRDRIHLIQAQIVEGLISDEEAERRLNVEAPFK